MLSFTTTFRGDDPTCLVDAALACPVCLAGGADWQLDLDPYDARADCRCGSCGTEFELYLPPEQALRLALTPAPDAPGDPLLRSRGRGDALRWLSG